MRFSLVAGYHPITLDNEITDGPLVDYYSDHMTYMSMFYRHDTYNSDGSTNLEPSTSNDPWSIISDQITPEAGQNPSVYYDETSNSVLARTHDESGFVYLYDTSSYILRDQGQDFYGSYNLNNLFDTTTSNKIIVSNNNLLTDLIVYSFSKQYLDWSAQSDGVEYNSFLTHNAQSSTDMGDLQTTNVNAAEESLNNPYIVYHSDFSEFKGINYVSNIHTVVWKNENDLLQIKSYRPETIISNEAYNFDSPNPDLISISPQRSTTGLIATLDTDGSRSDYLDYPDRYTSPNEQGLYSITFAKDSSRRYDFLDDRPYVSLFRSSLLDKFDYSQNNAMWYKYGINCE